MIYIGADHAGFELKETLKDFFRLQTIEFEDVGQKTMEPGDDFPIITHKLVEKVLSGGEKSLGILLCGTGTGVCIAANKHKGIRAGIGYNLAAAETMRSEDDANILCLAGRVLQPDFARAIVRKFLDTKFSGEERRVRRLKQIEECESHS